MNRTSVKQRAAVKTPAIHSNKYLRTGESSLINRTLDKETILSIRNG